MQTDGRPVLVYAEARRGEIARRAPERWGADADALRPDATAFLAHLIGADGADGDIHVAALDSPLPAMRTE